MKIAEMPTFVPSGLRERRKRVGLRRSEECLENPLNTAAKIQNLQLQGEEQKSTEKLMAVLDNTHRKLICQRRSLNGNSKM